MNWLAFTIFCLGIMGVLVGTNETANPPDPRQSPTQPEEDVDHFITYHNRRVGMCKGAELELQSEQMN